ncbi:UNVERIFIED_ORG: hypothetical protein QFZ59_000614 [Bacillus sp. B2I3]|nr:hypothetical protein [Bacillus sp. B2I3]
MPWKGKYLVYCRIKYQVTRNTASSLEFTALQYEYASTVEFTAFQLEIRHLWSNLLSYSTKYAIFARIYCLAPEYTSTAEFTALHPNTRLPSNSLPFSSKYAIFGRNYCLIARNTAASLESTSLQPEIRLFQSNLLPCTPKYGICSRIITALKLEIWRLCSNNWLAETLLGCLR